VTEFDPMKMVESSIRSGYDPGAVEDLDDRDVKWCPNVAQWIFDPHYLAIKTIYPAQLQNVLRLFGDVCPFCSDWDYYSKDWAADVNLENALDRIQLFHDGKCPKCSKTKLDAYHEKYWHFPHEFDFLWGMRSGKSAVVGMIATYVLHRTLRIPDPAAYYNLLKGSLLAMRFVAITAGQAEQTLWMQFLRSIETCDWFSGYHAFLRDYGKRKGVEMMARQKTQLIYQHKNLIATFLGASIDSSRGRTAFFSAFDEIGWWTGGEDAKRANPVETYEAYEKASRTLRNAAMSNFIKGDYNCLTGILGAVSSTMSKTDFMMRLIKSGKTDPRKVCSHKASWEVNPVFLENPEELEQEKRKNLKAFLRDYGSEPPFANDPFIDDESIVDKIAILEKPTWNIPVVRSSVGPHLDATGLEINRNIPYCLAIDIGVTNCGYAAALMQLKEDDFSVVEIAGLFAVYPQDGATIDIDGMYTHFIEPLCSKYNVKMVLYDRWNSKSQIQALKKLGIDANQYSLTYKDFINFRSQLSQGKLLTSKPEMPLSQVEQSTESTEAILYSRSYLHFLWQLLSVSEQGNKITKGDGHDDLFRAVALGTRFLWDDDSRKQFEFRSGAVNRMRGKSGLAISGVSRSGMPYGGQGGASSANVITVNNRVIGTCIPRGKKHGP